MRHEVTINRVLQRVVLSILLLGVAAGALAYAGTPRQPSGRGWEVLIQAMSEALARGDVATALRARESAFRAAMAGRDWQSMCAVGDASLRLGDASGLRVAMEPEARRAYRVALYRARQQGSVDGMLQAAKAFLALGDHELARRVAAAASTLASQSRDAQGLERVHAFQEQLTAAGPWQGLTSERAGSPGANASVLP